MEAKEMKKQNASILIVDDDKNICEILSLLVKKEGLKTLVAHEGDTALKIIRSQTPDIVLLDIKMPGMNGVEVLKRVKELDENLPVVMITAYANIQGAVDAIRLGAHDYLAKPFDDHEVIRVVHRALAERNLKLKLRSLSDRIQGESYIRGMMGPSDVIGQLIYDVNCVSKSDFTIVILGETGSGKELIARVIHEASSRPEGPFVPVDCGAIPETLLESELFGHEKGAFTGAALKKPGKFELAQGGTLFLDEILNMPLSSQAKLLRVLQDKKVSRVGSTKPINVDVRVLAASNRDLENAVVSGSFRRDLFYRLNEFTIKIPPLRERKEDIPYLVKRFLDLTNKELKKNVEGFSESAIERLTTYDWPGNVRQLRSTIRRAVLLANKMITEKHLDLKKMSLPGLTINPKKVEGIPWKDLSLKEIVQSKIIEVERDVLGKVLKYTGGNKAKAARILQIDYKTIHTKVKQLGIPID
jgi:DNA-binding NtrC family response regulator